MRVHQHGLRVCVADYANSAVAYKLVQLGFKTRPEICVFKIVDATIESQFFRIRGHTASSGSHMRLIICAVKQIGHARLLRHCAKKTAHNASI